MKKETKYDKFSRLDAKAKQQRAIATDKLIMESFPQDNWEEKLRQNLAKHCPNGEKLCVECKEFHQQNLKIISSVLKAQKEENDKEWGERIDLIKKRFRCAACDGAKCEHTQGCQALKELLK